MAKEIINIDYKIVPELNRFSDRTTILEELSKKNKRYIDMKALEWNTTVSELRREINTAKLEVNSLKQYLMNTKTLFINLVNEFKDTALEEDYRKLKHTIDDWHVDKLLTRKELKKLLKDRVQ